MQTTMSKIDETRTVFSEENICPPTSLNRHIVKIDCIYNKLKVTIYLYVSLVKIYPFLNEIYKTFSKIIAPV